MKLLFTFIFLIPFMCFAQVENPKWDFPVKPGSKEWLAIPDYSKRLELLNIPENILNKITTEELVKTCLSYPEFGLIFTRNDLQSGYDFIRSNFNGFRVLETRSDAGKELIKVYAAYQPEGFDLNSSSLTIGVFMSKFAFIEIMMAQSEILNRLNPGDSNELLSLCSQKYKVKKDLQKYYGGIGLKTTALIIARRQDKKLVNVKIKYGKEKVDAFINNVSLENIGLTDDIVSENDKILSDGL